MQQVNRHIFGKAHSRVLDGTILAAGRSEVLAKDSAVRPIFLSYSSADRSWAEMLEHRLLPHLEVYRDKNRLTASKPYQEQLFADLERSYALLIMWSKRVRDMRGEWKEWVITERERFRVYHPEAPIVYVRLDEETPQVDADTHMLDDMVGTDSPDKVKDETWVQLVQRIKQAVSPHTIEIACYVLACTDVEFASLRGNPNLEAVLQRLGYTFDGIADWYAPARENWRPAGASAVKTFLAELETIVTGVLKEEGVPEPFRESHVTIKSGLAGLWNVLDAELKKEIDRIAKTEFCWVFIDPLSLYHPNVQTAANRIVGCRERNQWLNVFILDPIGRVHDRSNLRSKLEIDFPSLYLPIVRPKFQAGMSCLGGVDVWHSDDFERAFRETIRLRVQTRSPQRPAPGPQRGLTTFGAGY
jgi:hypothetical protein